MTIAMEMEMRVMDMVMRGCHGRLSCKGCKPARQGSEGLCSESCCQVKFGCIHVVLIGSVAMAGRNELEVQHQWQMYISLCISRNSSGNCTTRAFFTRSLKDCPILKFLTSCQKSQNLGRRCP